MEKKLQEIASHFALEGGIAVIDSLGEGFINDTFIIRTEGEAPDYILQRKNKNIFPDVPAMMDNIRRVTDHIRRGVIAAGGDPRREVMTVVPTREGALYHIDGDGEYWAVSVFIDDTVAYNKADSPELARKGGEGIGKFQAQSKVEEGTIPTRVTHNDTKINNILFDRQGEVLCAIDLDTVMASTSLNDFGDAIRSYANTGDEDDRDLSRVGLSLEMFRAYTEGYLSQRAKQLTDSEIDHLAFSARYITFEQVLRFLMDYIDGDTYYKIKYPGHNLVRTHAQYRLLQSMEEHYGEMCRIVRETVDKYRKA